MQIVQKIDLWFYGIACLSRSIEVYINLVLVSHARFKYVLASRLRVLSFIRFSHWLSFLICNLNINSI